MKMISHKINIDINNVLDLANTKPFGLTSLNLVQELVVTVFQ